MPEGPAAPSPAAAAAAAAALALTGIRKTFHAGQPGERRALAGLDLVLQEGDFAVVIGSNGAGKSTLLGVVAGDVAPDAIRIAVGAIPERARLAEALGLLAGLIRDGG